MDKLEREKIGQLAYELIELMEMNGYEGRVQWKYPDNLDGFSVSEETANYWKHSWC